MAAASHHDVLIVGAGISGISAAYHLRTKCPNKSFAVLEGRAALGGTWDLFRYPGIRSDSDMQTLGFEFNPWRSSKAFADGPSILAYLHDTVRDFDLGDSIRYNTFVEKVAWSSADKRWTVSVRDAESNEKKTYTAAFVWACTGYYRYDRGHTPDFEGLDQFEGEVVHPQFWNDAVEYAGKRVIVIGSGATAVTLVPEVASRAAHTIMLQRSPTYMLSVPGTDWIGKGMSTVLGARIGARLTRWKNIVRIMFFFQLSRRFPRLVRWVLVALVRRALGRDFDVETHFAPQYNPWDQRVCFMPDRNLFAALKGGSASIVTDHIARFTPRGIMLKSGRELEADLIVTATGLELVAVGGATIEVDGEVAELGNKLVYKGTMLSDVPNAAMSLGYTNASWTLKCELISQWVCRLLQYMDENGHTQCSPRAAPDMKVIPLLDFNSGYVMRAAAELPKQGETKPWRLHQNYLLDRTLFLGSPINDGTLEFS